MNEYGVPQVCIEKRSRRFDEAMIVICVLTLQFVFVLYLVSVLNMDAFLHLDTILRVDTSLFDIYYC